MMLLFRFLFFFAFFGTWDSLKYLLTGTLHGETQNILFFSVPNNKSRIAEASKLHSMQWAKTSSHVSSLFTFLDPNNEMLTTIRTSEINPYWTVLTLFQFHTLVSENSMDSCPRSITRPKDL